MVGLNYIDTQILFLAIADALQVYSDSDKKYFYMHTVWALAMTMGGDAAELRSLARQMLGLSIWPTFDRRTVICVTYHSALPIWLASQKHTSAVHNCWRSSSGVPRTV